MDTITLKELKIQVALGTMMKYTYLYRPGTVKNFMTITTVAPTRAECNEIVNTYVDTLSYATGKITPRWDKTRELPQEVWVTWDKTSAHGSISILYDEERNSDPACPRDVDEVLYRS